MLIAQITDLHGVEEGHLAMDAVDTNRAVERAVERLNLFRPPPDLVIITGDLVNDGRPAQYAALARRLAALAPPYIVLPGNHDDRRALRAAFAEHDYLPEGDGPLDYAVDRGDVRIIALDTSRPGRSGGQLDTDQLAWLDGRLGETPQRPTLVALHHPPFDTGIGFMDRIGCAGGPALARVIARHPQVERVISGHVHRPVETRFAGTIASIAPSIAHQIPLALGETGSIDAWLSEPPGFALFHWNGAGLVGHLAYIDDFGRPVPY